jgi:hypothetical protein
MDGSFPAGWRLRLRLHPIKETDLGSQEGRTQARDRYDQRELERVLCIHWISFRLAHPQAELEQRNLPSMRLKIQFAF